MYAREVRAGSPPGAVRSMRKDAGCDHRGPVPADCHPQFPEHHSLPSTFPRSPSLVPLSLFSPWPPSHPTILQFLRPRTTMNHRQMRRTRWLSRRTSSSFFLSAPTASTIDLLIISCVCSHFEQVVESSNQVRFAGRGGSFRPSPCSLRRTGQLLVPHRLGTASHLSCCCVGRPYTSCEGPIRL